MNSIGHTAVASIPPAMQPADMANNGLVVVFFLSLAMVKMMGNERDGEGEETNVACDVTMIAPVGIETRAHSHATAVILRFR